MAELLPGYLIVGPDEVKRDTAIKRMKKRLEESGMADFNLDEREAPKEEDVESILASLNTYPMGADFRLVILKSAESPCKALIDMLVKYFENPSPTTVCLVQATSMAKSTRIYKAIAKLGKQAIIDCSAKKGRDLPALVQQMAKGFGCSIDPAACQELIARVGEGSTRALENELKLLARFAEGGVITRKVVEENVIRRAEVKPWELTDAISERNLAKALKYFRLQPQKNYVFIFSLICTRLRELIKTKSCERRGGKLTDALGLKPNMSWKVKNYGRWARAFSDAELEEALRSAVDVELAVKGSADAETALTMWITQICISRDKSAGFN